MTSSSNSANKATRRGSSTFRSARYAPNSSLGLRPLADEYRPKPGSTGKGQPSRIGRSPAELFADYLRGENVDDPRLEAMFAELLDEAAGAS